MKFKSYICCIALLAVVCMQGCVNNTLGNGATTNIADKFEKQTVQSTVLEETAAEKSKNKAKEYVDRLYDNDFGGRTVTIAATNPELFVPNMSGGEVDTALYYRNKLIEDKYNVKLNVVGSSNSSQIRRNVKNAVLADEYYADFVSVPMKNYSGLIFDESLYNLNTLPYMDYDADYMNDTLYDTMNMNGSLYCLFGSALNQAEYTYACYFNKDMLDLEYTTPYELHKKSLWDWDSLLDFPLTVVDEQASDAQGKEVLFPGYARYGSFSDNEKYFNAIFESGQTSYLAEGEDGLLEMSYITNSSSVLSRLLCDIMVNENVYNKSDYGFKNEYDAFAAGKLAFMPAKLSDLKTIAYSGVNFGVTAMPKLNSAQGKYNAWIDDSMPGIGVPAYCPDTQLTGSILNCFYAASFEHMQKALENEYVNKYLPDNSSALAISSLMSCGNTDVCYTLYDNYSRVKAATYGVWEKCIYDGEDFGTAYSQAQEKYGEYLKGIK